MEQERNDTAVTNDLEIDLAESATSRLADEPLRTVVLTPLPARIVGPGRRERDYLKRVARLEDTLNYEREHQRLLQTQLDLSQRVERGAQRRLDRIEQRLEVSQQRERRVAVLLGALQRENELLQRRVIELEAAALLLPPPKRARSVDERGFWARLFGRRDS